MQSVYLEDQGYGEDLQYESVYIDLDQGRGNICLGQ